MMGLEKPLFSLAPFILLPTSKCYYATLPAPLTTPALPITRPYKDPRHRRLPSRTYATLAHDSAIPPPSDPHIHWPQPTHPGTPPSPYQIFNQKRGEPYSKRRFYDLVKLYHPDRNNHPDDSSNSPNPCKCPRSVMLERYRLIIAANAILSDPLKREAYDRYGYGWTTLQQGHDPSQAGHPNHPLYKYSTQHRWRADGATAYQWPTDQDPMYNATWEDWERWYREQARARSPHYKKSSTWGASFFSHTGRDTVFTNNYAFASLVFLLAALGGIGQATRVNEASKSRMERASLVNEETTKLLMQARQDAREQSEGGETKDQRIRRFLRDKEVYTEGEFDGRVLREGDDGLCASGAVKDRDQPRFWEKPPENR